MDAEIYSASTARPDYFIDRSRYYLSSDDNGYIIDTIKNKSSVGVVFKDHQTITLLQGKVEKVLFKDSDIPSQYIPEGKRRFASLAYNKEAATLVFTIQVMQDPEQKQNAAVHILSCNLRTKQFKLIDKVNKINGKVNAGVANLIMDPQGKYIA